MNEFILTKEYKRFVEFCKACTKEKYIGLCYNPAGVGKSASAGHFAGWNKIEKLFNVIHQYPKEFYPAKPTMNMNQYSTLIYTPETVNSAKTVKSDIYTLIDQFNHIKERSIYGEFIPPDEKIRLKSYVELLIIDEAERLHTKSIEQVRDIYDRKYHEYGGLCRMAIIFIGMPGIEKRLVRFPQLYSRIGFVHTFKPLSPEEISFIIRQNLQTLNIPFSENSFMEHEAVATVARITQGNFRLINRLLKQALRIIEVNQLSFISKEVLEAARECLVIGNVS